MTTTDNTQSARNSDNRTERWATAVLVLGIAGLVVCTPILGIVAIFGSQRAAFGAKRTAGLILGWVQVAAVAAAIVIGTVLIAVSSSSHSSSPASTYTGDSRYACPRLDHPLGHRRMIQSLCVVSQGWDSGCPRPMA